MSETPNTEPTVPATSVEVTPPARKSRLTLLIPAIRTGAALVAGYAVVSYVAKKLDEKPAVETTDTENPTIES